MRLNILTSNPELVRYDPNVDEVNQPETYVCLWVWCLDHIERKDGESHSLSPTFAGTRFEFVQEIPFKRWSSDPGESQARANPASGNTVNHTPERFIRRAGKEVVY
jgi:hypothetical protein